MHEVLSDRIVPSGGDSGFRFRLAEFSSAPRIRVVDLRGSSCDDEIETVRSLVAEGPDGPKTHVWGIRSAQAAALAKKYYDDLGYYVAERNRYEFDVATERLTFGTDVDALGYGPEVPLLGTGAAKAVRTALNLGIVRTLRVGNLGVGRGKRRKTPEAVLAELLGSGAVSPFRLGSCLYFDAEVRGLCDGFRILDLPYDPI